MPKSETVARSSGIVEAKPAMSAAGSVPAPAAKPAISPPPGSPLGRPSLLQPPCVSIVATPLASMNSCSFEAEAVFKFAWRDMPGFVKTFRLFFRHPPVAGFT